MHSCGDITAICLDNTVQLMKVREELEGGIVRIDKSVTIEAHCKILNQCELEGNRLLTCSRDPIVKLFEINDESSQMMAEFKGHEMSVTTAGQNCEGKLVASGSRDQTTRL